MKIVDLFIQFLEHKGLYDAFLNGLKSNNGISYKHYESIEDYFKGEYTNEKYPSNAGRAVAHAFNWMKMPECKWSTVHHNWVEVFSYYENTGKYSYSLTNAKTDEL